MRLALLASHRGTNLGAILDACAQNTLDAEPVLVISNNSTSQALQRARESGIACMHLSRRTHPDGASLAAALLQALREHRVDLIVTVGYMKKLDDRVLAAYQNRVVNIHPSLLPAHGGNGMYGMKVHESVIASGDQQSGATVHLIDGDYDSGPIIAQQRLPVRKDETAVSLADKILQLEHELLVRTLQGIVTGTIRLDQIAQDHASNERGPLNA